MSNRFQYAQGRFEDRAERYLDKLSRRSLIATVFCVCVLFSVLGIVGWAVLGAAGIFTRTVNEAVEVAHREVGPAALNEKYKWFKDALAALDAKKASIQQIGGKIKRLREDYAGERRGSWARSDLDAVNQWETERDAIIASYNALASEYNAAMSKFHTAFVNAGKLPAGGTDGDLPREVREYIRETP